MIAAIDYSLTSPAITVGSYKGGFDECFSYFVCDKKKIISRCMDDKSLGVYGYEYWKDYENWIERYLFLAEWGITILKMHDVDFVYLEGYSYASTGKVFNIAENTAILKYKLYENQYKLCVVEPPVIKKFATGKGNANKVMMNEAFTKDTEIDLHEFFNLSKSNYSPSGDIVDSYYLYEYAVKEMKS